jgi:hypothetical protein
MASSVHGALQYRPARELVVALVNITIIGRYPEEMEVAGSSETSVPIYQAICRHVPQDRINLIYIYIYIHSEVQITFYCLRGVKGQRGQEGSTAHAPRNVNPFQKRPQ